MLISTRLGLKNIDKEYFAAISHFFMMRLNVGIIGGRPKEAFYLVGIQNEFLIFLDPHNTSNSVPADLEEIKSNHLNNHEKVAKKIHFTKLDPTMTFGFYLSDYKDYQAFDNYMAFGKKNFGEGWLFSCMETKPNFLKA